MRSGRRGPQLVPIRLAIIASASVFRELACRLPQVVIAAAIAFANSLSPAAIVMAIVLGAVWLNNN